MSLSKPSPSLMHMHAAFATWLLALALYTHYFTCHVHGRCCAMSAKVKFNLEMKFSSVHEKEAFKARLSQVRDLLTPPGSSKGLDNLSLMLEMFEAVESRTVQQEHPEHYTDRCTLSFMRHNGEVLCACIHTV